MKLGSVEGTLKMMFGMQNYQLGRAAVVKSSKAPHELSIILINITTRDLGRYEVKIVEYGSDSCDLEKDQHHNKVVVSFCHR